MVIQRRPKHDFCENVKILVRRCVTHFRILSLDPICLEALLAVIKIETLIALVPHISNRQHATSITFDCFFYCLTRFHDYFNAMFFRVFVAAYLQTFVGCSKVAVLTQTKVRATCANKTCPYNWLHITTDALVIAVGSQPVS